LFDTNVVAKFGPVVVAQADGQGAVAGSGYGGGQDYAPARSYGGKQDAYAGPGGYGGQQGAYGGQGYAGGGAGASDLAALLPKRPLSDEDRSGDYQFELQWQVQLLNPKGTAEATDKSE